MADEQRRPDPGDTIREGVRAVTGILGAFKDAIEQTFNDLSARGDISPERARDAARDAMKRAQDAMDEMRTRMDFVPRKEFDALRTELAELRAQVERHINANVHHQHAGGADSTPGTTPGTGTGAAGSGLGDGLL
jgi:polyhydroxyalkanoate synthesis regulator phasin